MTVLAATHWPTNADMIADMVTLGYIKPTDSIIDLTFGRGKWWTKYSHPSEFVANLGPEQSEDDIPEQMPERSTVLFQNYEQLTIADAMFDVVVFDPPYIAMGGRATSGIPDFVDRYGLHNAGTTPQSLHRENVAGLREGARIVKPGGYIMVKCAPYISSGRRQEADMWMRDAALDLGLVVHDMFIHIGDIRPQPNYATCRTCDGSGKIDVDPCKCGGKPTMRKQRHARNNYSVLYIFRRRPARKAKNAIAHR